MKSNAVVLGVTLFTLTACHEQSNHYTAYDASYIGLDDYHTITYDFVPGNTYRVVLQSLSGDADLAIRNERGDYVVYSEERGSRVDEVLFTADFDVYDIEIYGYYSGEYRIEIDEVPYNETGLYTDSDGLGFTIDAAALNGDLYTELASAWLDVTQQFDDLTIVQPPNSPWLSVVPNGTLYNERHVPLKVSIVLTADYMSRDYAVLRLVSQDRDNKVYVYKDIDVSYNIKY